MFYNHDADFAAYDPAIVAAPLSTPRATLSGQTLVETPRGWCQVHDLQAGDAIATLDGGFAEITAIRPTDLSTAMVMIPGGTLSACTDIALPGDTHVALDLPSHLSQPPLVTAPLVALCGWRGIRPTLCGAADLATIHLASEELIFAQTGVLIHASPEQDPFFDRLSYGETRAKIALLAAGFGPAATAAA